MLRRLLTWLAKRAQAWWSLHASGLRLSSARASWAQLFHQVFNRGNVCGTSAQGCASCLSILSSYKASTQGHATSIAEADADAQSASRQLVGGNQGHDHDSHEPGSVTA